MGITIRAQRCSLALAVSLLGLLSSASASIMAVDLGTEFIKVSLIKPGRSPIQIVTNEMSKRKSPALVGFVNGERLLGEEALSFSVRYPETTYSRFMDLLGKRADDATVTEMLKTHALAFQVTPHPTRGVAAVQPAEGTVVSAEELAASILQYTKANAEAFSGGPVLDAVLCVPAYYGQAQRQALIDAAQLAGLNVMGLINSHTAAALQYGIERDFSNKTSNIILYDIGSSSTVVALIKYSSYTTKTDKKPVSQLEVKDVDWDHTLGGNNLDSLLVEHFTKMFAEKNGYDAQALLANAKAMAKMKKQVRRTKEMLSANTAAPLSVEELYEGKDFQASITREAFEGMAGPLFKRAAAPLQRILDRNSLKIEDIEGVELLGGGSRVPGLQAALSEALSGRALDRHLDSDEAVVLGASLFAANLSTSFRLRKFGMTDLSMYGISMRIEELKQRREDPDAPEEPKVRNLLPHAKKLPIKRVVHFENVTADPIRVALSYNATTHTGLPPGVTETELAEFEITGVDDVIKRYNTSGVINLRFEADLGGVLRLNSAEASVEYEVMEEKIVTVKEEANTTAEAGKDGKEGAEAKGEGETNEGEAKEESKEDGKEGEDKDGAEAGEKKEGEGEEAKKEGEGEEAKKEGDAKEAGEGKEGEEKAGKEGEEKAKNGTTVKRIQVAKKKMAKVKLSIGGKGWRHPLLEGDDLKKCKDNIVGWVKAETIKRETAAAKNELEAYIIKTREDLDADETLQKVTLEEDRATFKTQLDEAEDWLYMDGEAEAAPAFRAKLAGLKKVGDPMRRRAHEFTQRPQLVEAAKGACDLHLKVANAWADSKPWIEETERSDVVAKLEGFQKWLADKQAAQAKLKDTEDPAFTVEELALEFQKVDKLFNKINNKKQPKPPPPPPNTTSDANATEADAGKGEAGGKGGAEGEAKEGADGKEGEAKKGETAAEKKEREKKEKAEREAKAKAEAAAKAKAEKERKDKEKKERAERDAKLKAEKRAKAEQEKKGGRADKGKGGKKTEL